MDFPPRDFWVWSNLKVAYLRTFSIKFSWDLGIWKFCEFRLDFGVADQFIGEWVHSQQRWGELIKNQWIN